MHPNTTPTFGCDEPAAMVKYTVRYPGEMLENAVMAATNTEQRRSPIAVLPIFMAVEPAPAIRTIAVVIQICSAAPRTRGALQTTATS